MNSPHRPPLLSLRWRLRLAQQFLARVRRAVARLLTLPHRQAPSARRALASMGLLLALGGPLVAPPASAALAAPQNTIAVSAGASGDVDNGACSLIEAIINANNDDQSGSTDCAAGSGADMITLPASSTLTYTTGGSGNALPDITSEVTIQGNGSTIQRGSGASTLRMVRVGATGTLTLDNATISGFNNSAILVDDGTLRVSNGGVIANNSASLFGGGIYFDGGSVEISNSTLTGNSAYFGGGAIHIDDDGALTIIDSTLSNNSATSVGGAISKRGVLPATVSIRNSTLSGNSASLGGTFQLENGSVEISYSVLQGNSADTAAAGRVVAMTGSISHSLIRDNVASYNAAALQISGGADIEISNSTISGNSTSNRQAGLYVTGSGTTVTLLHSTITRNSATNDSGGIRAQSSSTVALVNSIVSGNQASSGAEIDNGDASLSSSYSVIGYGGSARSSGFTPSGSDVVPGSALTSVLDTTLANNGGPTLTHMLVNGSPALDLIATSSAITDQRGELRPFNGDGANGAEYDAGAVEVREVLAITLAAFAAQPADGGVALRWETLSEQGTVGFHIRRSTDAAHPGARSTDALIPARAPGSGQGASYAWTDETAEQGMTYYYWLEEVASSGATTLHGPVSATRSGPTALRSGPLQTQPLADGGTLLAVLLALFALAGIVRRRGR